MISTTIKKIYMDKILSGEKTIEYKALSIYWLKRIGLGYNLYVPKKHKIINFLCGKKSYKFKIKKITIGKTPDEFFSFIRAGLCYHIHLGERIDIKICEWCGHKNTNPEEYGKVAGGIMLYYCINCKKPMKGKDLK